MCNINLKYTLYPLSGSHTLTIWMVTTESKPYLLLLTCLRFLSIRFSRLACHRWFWHSLETDGNSLPKEAFPFRVVNASNKQTQETPWCLLITRWREGPPEDEARFLYVPTEINVVWETLSTVTFRKNTSFLLNWFNYVTF